MRSFRRRRRSRGRTVIAVVALALIAAGAAWAVSDGLLGSDKKSGLTDSTAALTTTLTASAATSASWSATAPVTQPAAAATPTPDASRPATITVAGAGDMIFDRQVKALIKLAGGEAPLAHVASILKAADVAIANLESTLASSGKENAAKDVTFRGDPRGIESLKVAELDAVSLANNHVLDYGPEPLLDTIKALDRAGIGHAGAGKDKTAAWMPATIERNGTTTAYLAYSHIVPAGFIAQDDRAGFASGRQDMNLVEDAIREAKKTHDYVIVSFHWGIEYTDNPTAEQVKNAHRAIDAGADMVLAHHPHVIQGVEFYKDGLIAYSLGDFVFDHYSRKTGEAFILNASMGPDGITDVSAIPVYLDKYGRPEVVTGSEGRSILTRLKAISGPLGTTVNIIGDRASIHP